MWSLIVKGRDKRPALRGRLSEWSLVGPNNATIYIASLDCGIYRASLNFPPTSRIQQLYIFSYHKERHSRRSSKLLTGVQPIGAELRITETPDIWGCTKPPRLCFF